MATKLDDLRHAVASHYDIGKIHRCNEHPAGFVNRTYRIDAKRGSYALTTFQQKTMEEIAARADVLLRLHKTPVAPPLASRSGAPVIDIGGRPAWLAPWIEGISPVKRQHHNKYPMSERQHREVISAFHTLHNELAAIVSQGIDLQPFGPLLHSENIDASVTEDILSLIARCRDCHRSVTKPPANPQSLVNRDFERQNLLFQKDQLVGVMDFDALGIGDIPNEWAHCIFNHACCDPQASPDHLEMYLEATPVRCYHGSTRESLLQAMAHFCEKDIRGFCWIAQRREVDVDAIARHYQAALSFAMRYLG